MIEEKDGRKFQRLSIGTVFCKSAAEARLRFDSELINEYDFVRIVVKRLCKEKCKWEIDSIERGVEWLRMKMMYMSRRRRYEKDVWLSIERYRELVSSIVGGNSNVRYI